MWMFFISLSKVWNVSHGAEETSFILSLSFTDLYIYTLKIKLAYSVPYSNVVIEDL